MKRALFVGTLALSLAWSRGIETAAGEKDVKELANDLVKGGLSAKGDLAQVTLQKMGTSAAAAEPYVLPLLDHKKGDVRFRAIKVLAAINPGGNQTAFKRIALKETERDPARAIAAAITDDTALADLVRSGPRPVREAAAIRLARSPLLLEIASSHPDLQVRGDAIFALADDAALTRLAKDDPLGEIRQWAAAAAAAVPVKDLALDKAGCQRSPWKQSDLICEVTVTNRGAVAYDDLFFRLRGVAGGEMHGAERIEPGQTKKYPLLGSAGGYGGTVFFDLVRAQRYRTR